jgi:hypothetical protein
VCKCKIGGGSVAGHATSCNVHGLANERHEDVRRCWVDVLRMLRASVLVPGEFAPFGYGDNRRVDGLISGVPGLPRETGVDYAVTSVLSVGGSAAGAKAALGAAALKEQDKRRGSVPQRRMDIDMQSAGYGFLPVVHETTGALGREAHDALLAPLLLRMQEDDEARLEARAAMELLGELPWNARTIRAYFLRRVGVAIAAVVGTQIASAKHRGRQELGRRILAQEASDSALSRRPSGLARASSAPSPICPAVPPRARSLQV